MTQPSLFEIPKPRNQTAEVLFELLRRDSVTHREIIVETGVLSPTARITELRQDYGLQIPCTSLKTRNKHNRAISYGSWSLAKDERDLALTVYRTVNQ